MKLKCLIVFAITVGLYSKDLAADYIIPNLTVVHESRDHREVLYFEIPASIHNGEIYGHFADAIEILDVWDEVARLPRFVQEPSMRKLNSEEFVGQVTYRYERFWNRWSLGGERFDEDGNSTGSVMYLIASETKRLLIKYRFRVPGGGVDADRYMLWINWDAGIEKFPDYQTMAQDMLKEEPSVEEVTRKEGFPDNAEGYFELIDSLFKEREILREMR